MARFLRYLMQFEDDPDIISAEQAYRDESYDGTPAPLKELLREFRLEEISLVPAKQAVSLMKTWIGGGSSVTSARNGARRA